MVKRKSPPKLYKHPYMTWGEALPPQVRTVPLKLPKASKAHFTEYSCKTARKWVRQVKKHIGKKIYVYGGGGADSNLVKLKGIDAVPVKYYLRSGETLPKGSKTGVNKLGHEVYTPPHARCNIIPKLDGLGSQEGLFTKGSHYDKKGMYHDVLKR